MLGTAVHECKVSAITNGGAIKREPLRNCMALAARVFTCFDRTVTPDSGHFRPTRGDSMII